jgi:hypothetical protein
MRFETVFPASRISNNVLIYRGDEFSFDVVPRAENFTSILINDLNLELNERGRVVSVWGLCPYTMWKIVALDPPAAEFGDVFYISESTLRPGVSTRLSRERWPILVDASSGWVYVDGGRETGQAVKILTGIILEIDKRGSLRGIWLKPESLPNLN